MKEIMAFIRPERWPATSAAISDIGIESIMQRRVVGRGKQMGLRYLRRATDSGQGDMPYLSKRMLVCIVPDEMVDSVIKLIIALNQTGNVGDGKIFVRPLSQVQRIEHPVGESAEANLVGLV